MGIPILKIWNKLTNQYESVLAIKGEKGDKGDPGYTPQKGVDYWTDADIQSMVADAVSGVIAQKATILEATYPVGAVYMSASATNPKTLFGFGTWARIQDCFLLAAGSAYSAGSTGGEATHTLTVDEMPSHRHDFRFQYSNTTHVNGSTSWQLTKETTGDFTSGDSSEMYVQTNGGGAAHNNMPPYLAVYVWKRTA